MDYSTAKAIRGRSLSSMITQKIRAGGGVGSSIGRSISQKIRAKGVGIKEKFDPLNIAKFLTGGSNLAPAILGRLTGRKQSDINYFSGGRKTATQIGGSGALGRMQNTPTDSLSSLFTFIRQSYEQDLRMRETERTFQEEKSNEEQRRHNEFLKALKDYTSGATAVMVKPEKEGGGLLDFINSLFEKLISPFKWLLENKQILFNILRLFTGPLAGILLAGSAIVWLADQLKTYLRENVANQNVISPEEAVKLLQSPGAYREMEKFGGREALLKIAKEGHIEAAKILATGDMKKINDAGGKEFLEAVVARGAVPIPENLQMADLSQFAEQGPKRPKGSGSAIKSNQENWDKKWSKVYDPETGRRLDLLSSPGSASPAGGSSSSTSPAGQNMSQVPAAPMSSPVYGSSSENADLNMMGNVGNGAPAAPIVTNSVNNSSTEQPMPATASIRDSTDVLSRVMNQSAAYV